MPRIKDLTAKSGNLSNADFFATDNGTVVTKIDYTALAKAIIEQYNGSTLAGSAQSVQAALNSLNSNITNLSSGTILDYVKSQVAAGVPEGHFLATSAVTDIPASGNWFISYVRNTGSNIVQVKATLYNDSRVIYNTHIGNYQSSTAFAREWTQEPTRAEMPSFKGALESNSTVQTITGLSAGFYQNRGNVTDTTVVPTSYGVLIVLPTTLYYKAFIYLPSYSDSSTEASIYWAVTASNSSIKWRKIQA